MVDGWMDPAEAERIGNAWRIEQIEVAQIAQELSATAEAAARALLAYTCTFAVICSAHSHIDAARAACLSSAVLKRDFERLDGLRHKLWLARKNFSDTTMPIAMRILADDGLDKSELSIMKKMLEEAISAMARALNPDSENDIRVTKLAELLIELRAEVTGTYSVQNERESYAFARGLMNSLTAEIPPPKPAPAPRKFTDAELDARLNALV
jgi:hypothetical protein